MSIPLTASDDNAPRTPPTEIVSAPHTFASATPVESLEGPVATVPSAQSTPVAIKSSSYRSSTDKAYSSDRRARMANDMVSHWAEVPLDIFMSEMLPIRLKDVSPTDSERATFKNFREINNVKYEKQMYPILCEGVQSAFVLNKLSVKDTGEWNESTDDDKELRRTDLAVFRPKQMDRAQQQFKAFQKSINDDNPSQDPSTSSSIPVIDSVKPKKPKSIRTSRKATKPLAEKFNHSPRSPETYDPRYLSRLPYAARTLFSGAISYIEVKYTSADFPFGVGPGEEFIPVNKDGVKRGGEETRGQLTEYAAEMFRRQHRTFVFSVSISHQHAHLIRWDRQGAIVSEAFNYVSEPYKLHLFFYKLDQMDDEELGYDSSVSVATPEEASFMRAYQSPNDYHAELLLEAIKKSEVIYKVPIVQGGVTREFLVGKHEVYARLTEKPVPFIATVICGADVRGSNCRTLTQEYITSPRYHKRQHYRLALIEIGRPLNEYRSEFHLLCHLHNVLTAHCAAWEDAEVLHRDISPNNIVIVDMPEGPIAILIDWDLCKYKEDMMKEPTQYNRSGTYIFMSALLLNYPHKRHEVSEDLESFIHLINWFALDYHEHNLAMTPVDFTHYLKYMYEPGYQSPEDVANGKLGKLESVQSGRVSFRLSRSIGLQELITKLMELGSAHYSTVNFVSLGSSETSSKNKQPTQNRPAPSKVSAMNMKIPRLLRDDSIHSRAQEPTSVSTTRPTLPKPIIQRHADVASGSSVNTPKDSSVVSSGFLYDHKAILAIVRRLREEAEAELEADGDDVVLQPDGSLPPGCKWLFSDKLESQFDKLPGIELHFRRSSFISHRFTSKRSSTGDVDEIISEPETKRPKTSVTQDRITISSSGGSGLVSVEEEKDHEEAEM
ncbi:hypothetical protein C8Q75DRAFT_804797 [Abortiporus biennis]|nr:hypothetical protein C8Q75DRAFT_804797 [Abortiporus biennis]